MKRNLLLTTVTTMAVSVFLLASLLLACYGCCIHLGACRPRVDYERTVQLIAPLQTGSLFEAKTGDGHIIINGSQTTDCNLTATITAYASSEQAAKALAEEIKVSLKPDGHKLAVKIEKPILHNTPWEHRDVSVALDVTIPAHTNLDLFSSDGPIKISKITGSVTAKTSDGPITCTKIKSDTISLKASDGAISISDSSVKTCDARTSDGSITCSGLRADNVALNASDGSIICENLSAEKLSCRTSDGHIIASFAPTAEKAIDATLITSDGNITILAGPGLSAVIDASTSDGSITTQLPMMVTGNLGKSIKGTIGEGKGKLYLRTSDGSITIK